MSPSHAPGTVEVRIKWQQHDFTLVGFSTCRRSTSTCAGPGLKAHTLIVGQSGSGKSFMLGRFLEEIAAKTSARMVILDPNSDFVEV